VTTTATAPTHQIGRGRRRRHRRRAVVTLVAAVVIVVAAAVEGVVVDLRGWKPLLLSG